MKIRFPFAIGAAVGYVLGTKAGRERYEQIMRASRRVTENPNVQEAAGVLRTKGGEVAGVAKEKAGTIAGTAREKMPSQLGDKVPGLGKSDTVTPPKEYQDPRQETGHIH
ncbi:YtxH domain-containing protein [Actinomadura macrotermitis]|uniref:YtxH domain-containing protein n=1 Tax=Actinomadura macrotermitis TaxID=2585200 RepID=A0A7K0BN98_9ACTN|nr:YtxH domain-containing protein [Actinomadura macrotermitis]MQY02633.1 hypothetical protein [Actinomadura macrotermitis]